MICGVQFTEQEAKLRQLARSVQTLDDKDSPVTVTGDEDNKCDAKSSSSSAAGSKGVAGGAAAGGGGGGKLRPAWAMSAQQQAESKTTEDDLGDEEGLLKFAESLDFGRLVNDMEVHVMAERLKKRIQELEREVVQDEQREVDVEERGRKREMLAMMVNLSESIL